MAAEREEVVVRADGGQTQDVREEAAEDFFVGVPTLASLAVGMGIAAASCWRWNVSRGCDRPDPMAR